MSNVEYVGTVRAASMTPLQQQFLIGLINRLSDGGPAAESNNLDLFGIEYVQTILDRGMPLLNETGQTTALELMALLRADSTA